MKKCLQFNASRLKDDEVKTQYAETTKNWFECLMTTTEMEAETENLTPPKEYRQALDKLENSYQ